MLATEKPRNATKHRGAPRTPPADIEAEKALIGSLLLDPARVDEVAGLVNPSAFYLPSAGNAFGAIQQLVNAGKPVDALTVFDRLQKTGAADNTTAEWLAEALDATPHAAHAGYYAQVIAERYDRRSLIELATGAMEQAWEQSQEIEAALATAEARLHDVIERRSGVSHEATDIRRILIDTLAQIHSGKQSGSPTGFIDLDAMTGGLQPGSLVIVAARPSVGKTTFAGNLARGVAKQGTGVLFVSLEQSRMELAARFLASESGIGDLMRGRALSQHESTAVLEAASRLEELPIEIDETTPRTVGQLIATTRIRRRKAGIGCVIVDYLQLIEPTDKRIPREQQVADITRQLKHAARQLRIPVIALAQLNRGIENREDKKPRLSDLRESGAVEQDADMIWFLDRPSTYREDADETEASIWVAKHRNGKVGNVPLYWDGPTFSFKNAAHSHHVPTVGAGAAQGAMFGDDSF
jgi:replicative DNA helicase